MTGPSRRATTGRPGGGLRGRPPRQPGVGDAPFGDPQELTVDAMAGDVEALLDALGMARARVGGWSMGGFVARRPAPRAPERVCGLVLLEA